MKFLRNLRTALTQPAIARSYARYRMNRWNNAGQAVQVFPDGVLLTGWSGFSEFHCLGSCLTTLEREFLQTFPFSSGDFIDVGANLGLISLTLAKRFPTRFVHAFEPNPSTYEALNHNVLLNRCNNIQTQPYVVTNQQGMITFNADPIRRGTTRIANQGSFLRDLPCLTLDDYAQHNHLTEIAFLKVDVEGYEVNVFRGAHDLLKHQIIHVIYYEVCPENSRQCGYKPEASSEILLENGYSIYRLEVDGSLQRVNSFQFDQVILENWIAFKPC